MHSENCIKTDHLPNRLNDLLLTIGKSLGAYPALLNFNAIQMRPGKTIRSFDDNIKAKKLLGWKLSPLDQAMADKLSIAE